MSRTSPLCATTNEVLAVSTTASTRGGSVPRRPMALLAFSLVVAAASQSHAALQSGVNVLTNYRDGTWNYAMSTSHGPDFGSPDDYPTTIPAIPFQPYVLPDYNPSIGADHWSGGFAANDAGTYHVFTTYLHAGIQMLVPVTLTRDDGHSRLIDGQFVGGGGFGSSVSHQLYLPSGVRRRIDVVGYNAVGPWSFSVGETGMAAGATDPTPGPPLRRERAERRLNLPPLCPPAGPREVWLARGGFGRNGARIDRLFSPLLLAGQSREALAASLGMTEHTVDDHVKAVDCHFARGALASWR